MHPLFTDRGSLLTDCKVVQPLLCAGLHCCALLKGEGNGVNSPGTVGELLGACAASAGADPAGFTAWQGWGCAALQYVYVATARAYAGSGCARLEARAAAFLEGVQEERTWGEGGMGEAEGAHRAAREGSELASEPVIPLEPFALLVNALCVPWGVLAFARAFPRVYFLLSSHFGTSSFPFPKKCRSEAHPGIVWSPEALEALRCAAEDHVVEVFERARASAGGEDLQAKHIKRF